MVIHNMRARLLCWIECAEGSRLIMMDRKENGYGRVEQKIRAGLPLGHQVH